MCTDVRPITDAARTSRATSSGVRGTCGLSARVGTIPVGASTRGNGSLGTGRMMRTLPLRNGRSLAERTGGVPGLGFADDPRGIADDDGCVGHVLRDHRPRAHDRGRADGPLREDDGAGTDEGAGP